MQLVKPELVIFDWDNTLVSSWDRLYDTMNKTLISFNLEPWSLNKIKTTMHRSSRDFFPEVFAGDWEKAKKIFYEHYQLFENIAVTPLDDVVQTLKTLKDHNVKMAILSNKTGKFLRKEIQDLKWDVYFDCVLGAYDLDEDKPSPKPVFHILEQLNIGKGSYNWFVGDTIVDIECAVNSECYPILFGDQLEHAPHPNDTKIIHSHALTHKHLIDIFNSIK